jgi:predicted HNH restriction endonuclease
MSELKSAGANFQTRQQLINDLKNHLTKEYSESLEQLGQFNPFAYKFMKDLEQHVPRLWLSSSKNVHLYVSYKFLAYIKFTSDNQGIVLSSQYHNQIRRDTEDGSELLSSSLLSLIKEYEDHQQWAFLDSNRNGHYEITIQNNAPESFFKRLYETILDIAKNVASQEEGNIFPEELKNDDNQKPFYEGSVKQITVNSYERDTKARQECIAIHGLSCAVCGFNFEAKYGKLGKDFIHVHHLKPLAEIQAEYRVDPEKDLRPICPNCHAMLHSRKEIFTIDKLKKIIDLVLTKQDPSNLDEYKEL